MKKIKKIIVILLIFLLYINQVNASEYPDITEDIEIRYKWYKEKITGDYCLKKDIKEGDLVDENNIKYGQINNYYDKKYCELPTEYYHLEKRIMKKYKKVKNTRYVLIENFNYNDNIRIYQNNKEINFEIIGNENNKLKIDLKIPYLCEKLLFAIKDAKNYKISLYTDENFVDYIISKEIVDEEISSPDKTWITEKTTYVNHYTGEEIEDSDLTTKISQYYECRYRDIYIYKYEVKKEYYDDDYHLNVEGYIKDTNDYKYFYKGNSLINTIEITKEKIVKEPKYIYIEKENLINKNDSSKIETNCLPEIKTQIKTEIIEKEVLKIPKIIYMIIISLIIAIIVLIIKLCKKYVVQKY